MCEVVNYVFGMRECLGYSGLNSSHSSSGLDVWEFEHRPQNTGLCCCSEKQQPVRRAEDLHTSPNKSPGLFEQKHWKEGEFDSGLEI